MSPVGEPSESRREVFLELLGVASVRVIATLVVLATGFHAVSDDDYARVVIAETFVATPQLDPSGTSWLPFPFWTMGAVMAALGRSLATARFASVALAVGAGVCLHIALIASKVPRTSRLVGLATVFALPWTLWTTAATVPEAPTAALAAAAVLLAALPAPRSHGATLGAGALMLAATLSRYEAWPVAVVVSALLLRSVRGATPRERVAIVAGALLALAGPCGWMAWNHLSHGSATHFVARVASYKRALGAPHTSALERVFSYPRLLLVHLPETAALGALLVLAPLARAVWRRRKTRPSPALVAEAPFAPGARASLVAAVAVLAFLTYGNLRDGAPTHHAERALLPIAFLLVPLGIAELFASPSRGLRRAAALVAGLAALLALRRLAHPPGEGEASRATQVALGERLRAEGAPPISVEPCAYEHFALLAAHGAPERVVLLPRRPSPGPGLEPGPEPCPRVLRAGSPRSL